MEEIHGALRVRGGREDRALVLAEDLEPVRQVRGVVLARLGRDAEIRAQERGTELRDKFFAGVARVAEALAADVAVEPGRMLGPVFAGLVISTLGVALAFWLNALSFIAVIVTLLCVHAKQERRPSSGNTLQEFWEGIHFMSEHPRMQDLIGLLILTTFFGFASIQLLPAFATDILHGQAETLGLLLGASAAGALIGSLLIAPLVLRLRRVGAVVSIAVIWVGSWFALFALSTFLPLSLLCLVCTGLGTTVVVTMVVGLVQMLAPQVMRGRLQSLLLMVSFGFQPIAALVLGSSATWLSAPGAVFLAGLLMLIGATLLLVFRFSLRTWEINPSSKQVEQKGERATT